MDIQILVSTFWSAPAVKFSGIHTDHTIYNTCSTVDRKRHACSWHTSKALITKNARQIELGVNVIGRPTSMNSLSCVHSHCAVFPRRSDARAAQGKKAKCGALAPGESLGRQRAAWWVLSSMRFMSCAFFVGWCGSTKRIHYACVWSIGCRFSYILDFRCVAWEMKKAKNTCASVNTTKIDTHARLYELGGNEQNKLSCQASHTFCKPWRWRMADVWAINRMATVQTVWLSVFERPWISMQARG